MDYQQRDLVSETCIENMCDLRLKKFSIQNSPQVTYEVQLEATFKSEIPPDLWSHILPRHVFDIRFC